MGSGTKIFRICLDHDIDFIFSEGRFYLMRVIGDKDIGLIMCIRVGYLFISEGLGF